MDRSALSSAITCYTASQNLEMQKVDNAGVPLATLKENAGVLQTNGYTIPEVTKILFTRRQSQQYHADNQIIQWARSCILVAAPGDTSQWSHEDAQWRCVNGTSYDPDFR